MTLKIFHISQSDFRGGASRAAVRLHESQLRTGITSEFYTRHTKLNNKTFRSSIFDGSIANLKSRLSARAANLICQDQNLRSLNLFQSNLASIINNSDADLVHLHWINGEFLSIEDIGEIKKPIFWTLHDFWPVQGTAHYSESLKSCSPNFLCQKIDAWVIKRKKHSWLNKKINFIAPSSWVYEVAINSQIGKLHNIEQIHHGIDTFFWKPITIGKSQKPENTRSKKTLDILFASPSAFADPNKGFLSLLEAARLSVSKDKKLFVKIIVIDSAKDAVRFPKHNQILFENVVRPDTDTALRALYNSVDIVCTPSKQETFGLVALEAQACGKPVLAFNYGGVKDIVIHNVTGYLAEPFSAKSLGAALNQLATPEVRVRMGKQARNNIINKFQASYAAERMISAYHKNREKS